MTTNRDLEAQRDAAPPAADGFPARLATLVGNMSVRAFARKAGVSDTFLRQCLAGRTEPTRTKLLALADAGGVSVQWLATGTSDTARQRETAAFADRELLETIIEVTESVLESSGRRLSPASKARLIGAVYDTYAGSQRRSISRDAIVELVNCAT
ncbi:MAG: helix-turn-helix domain-containing protein [Halofilum sp. (in: g-proteobacteria)]|nr:helix-turn-helix domain-containing protein [Halofilum sp. (in: g-proteobacteria)]